LDNYVTILGSGGGNQKFEILLNMGEITGGRAKRLFSGGKGRKKRTK